MLLRGRHGLELWQLLEGFLVEGSSCRLRRIELNGITSCDYGDIVTADTQNYSVVKFHVHVRDGRIFTMFYSHKNDNEIGIVIVTFALFGFSLLFLSFSDLLMK